MSVFYKKFSFLSKFLSLDGDEQTRVELQLKDHYSQDLLTLSQFIGDKDFDTTFFLWIGFSFTVKTQKSSKNLKKTIDILNMSYQKNIPNLATFKKDMTIIQVQQRPNQATNLQ